MSDRAIITHPTFVTPYGTELGVNSGVPGYSNGSDEFFSGQKHYQEINGQKVFLGIGWQCVEYGRRWLVINKGVTLPSIPCAYDIWDLTAVPHLPSGEYLPLVRVPNSSKVLPRIGNLVIWEETDESPYGHVAVITAVLPDEGIVKIAEQNKDNDKWPGDYARTLNFSGGEIHGYAITDPDLEEKVYGWMYVAHTFTTKPHLTLSCQMERVHIAHEAPLDAWLDPSDPADIVYREEFLETTFVQRKATDTLGYYVVTEGMASHLATQTDELHHMCMAATDNVIKSDEMLDLFNIPKALWPKVRQSWARGDKAITGRFDLAFDGDQIKMFEYNADSSGTMYECAVIQEKYCKANKVEIGVSAGALMHDKLVSAWRRTGITTRVHFMIDTDREEMYSALYMQKAAKEAGLDCKICVLFDEFSWKGEDIVDSDGVPVRFVWKLWMWETCFKRWEEGGSVDRTKSPRLQDILLKDDVIVFEPLWKVITSNKALLPIIFQLYPNHPSLLNSSFTLTPELACKQYVKKPIVGRCGFNVTLMSGAEGREIAHAEGIFGDRKAVYQEMFAIPQIHGYYPILGTWVVDGKFAGFGVREDTKLITDVDSPYSAVRIAEN
jgi:glutathionylspermidine synthase